MKSWRMVETVFTATIAVPETGPWTPLGPMGNRGPSGPPAWGWRDSSRAYHWETGTPPATIGVLCDDAWRPIPAADLPAHVQPPGGWHRSQAARQREAESDAAKRVV